MGYELIKKTIPEQISLMAETKPDKVAYIFPDEEIRLTFKEVSLITDKIAKSLLALNLKHGDHIGIWSMNCSAWVELLLGAAKLGVIVVPLNTSYKYEELDDLCDRGDLDALFVMEGFRGKSFKAITDNFFEDGSIKAKYPRLKNVISFSETDPEPYMNWKTFVDLSENTTDEQLDEAKAKVSLEDDYLIQYTSGTTSKPKGAILYQYGVMNTGKAYAHLLHMGEDDCTCVPLPLFHCFGNILTLLGGLISGSSTIYLSAFSPKQMLQLIQDEGCTCMMGVPTMYFAMLAMPNFADYDLSKLTKAGIGGSLCPYELCKRISEGFGIDGLIIGYGLSEAASLCTLSDIYDDEMMRIGSVGPALPGLEVSLADGNGKENPEIKEGELIIRGYGVMKGYYKDPEHTAEALDADGWLHTGDLGRRYENGTFAVVGRLKDIVIKGGENISPSDIEEKLLQMENVRECQCVGVPDEKYGEVVCACVITKDGSEISIQEIQKYLKNKIAIYKIPDYAINVTSFPINGSGKVLKNKLSEIAKQELNL